MGGKIAALKQRATEKFAAARARSAQLDHVVRAKQRYDDRRGDRQAGAVTYFGFLSFFPLIALAFAAVGYASVIYDAEDQIQRGIESALPGLSDQINIQGIAAAKRSAGIIGLLGLLWAGTGWVDALREALRSMWLQKPHGGANIVIKKAFDVVVLVTLGLALVASVAISGVASAATQLVLGWVDLADSILATWLLRLLAVLVAVASNAVIFAVMFWRLSGVHIPRGRLLRGALLAGVGFEILKQLGTFLIGNTTDNPIYATFAVAVGLLIWINFVSRVTLLAAAWTATDAYSEGVHGEPRDPEDSLEPAEVRESEADFTAPERVLDDDGQPRATAGVAGATDAAVPDDHGNDHRAAGRGRHRAPARVERARSASAADGSGGDGEHGKAGAVTRAAVGAAVVAAGRPWSPASERASRPGTCTPAPLAPGRRVARPYSLAPVVESSAVASGHP
jgi:membrane protein